MKKTIVIVIFAAFILATFPSIVFAWNPPGMVVRDDGQSLETPWSGIESIGVPDNGDIMPIEQQDLSSSDSYENPINDLFDVIIILPYSAMVINIIQMPGRNEAD
ncbi:MAG: hypothetical protein AB1746_16580 [Candidatus Zixiibacteriota bacterium]